MAGAINRVASDTARNVSRALAAYRSPVHCPRSATPLILLVVRRLRIQDVSARCLSLLPTKGIETGRPVQPVELGADRWRKPPGLVCPTLFPPAATTSVPARDKFGENVSRWNPMESEKRPEVAPSLIAAIEASLGLSSATPSLSDFSGSRTLAPSSPAPARLLRLVNMPARRCDRARRVACPGRYLQASPLRPTNPKRGSVFRRRMHTAAPPPEAARRLPNVRTRAAAGSMSRRA